MNWLEAMRGAGQNGAGLVFAGIVIGGMAAEWLTRGWFGRAGKSAGKEIVDRFRAAGMGAGAVIGWMWK